MSNETLFYAFGAAVVLLALGTSAIGIRSKSFPSAGAYRAGAALFAVLVTITAVFAVTSARDEARHRAEEEAHKPGHLPENVGTQGSELEQRR